ncbi:MAG: class I SAM-dependent methyltransferase [Desulfobacteraceae bacterium]|nr:MAG: class I SAM-dependent methyltransferase [Desulfobacteraceae bacterium]
MMEKQRNRRKFSYGNLIHALLDLSKFSEAAACVETYAAYLSPQELRSIEERLVQFVPPASVYGKLNRKQPSAAGDELSIVFRQIYAQNAWACPESRSGHGSTLSQTRRIRQALPLLIRELKARSFLDIPCGDLNWMQHVPLGVDIYIGADIVEELVCMNREQYGNEFRKFLKLDITQDQLPRVDLIFCRDCLGHLTSNQIRRAIFNIIDSQSKYLAGTTFPEHGFNPDIQAGMWRPINLEKPPFGLPPPQVMINENYSENGGRFRDKSIGVWEVSSLRATRFPLK